MMQSVGYDIASSEHRDQINTSGSAGIQHGSRPEPDDGLDFHSNIYRMNDRVGIALVPVHNCVQTQRRCLPASIFLSWTSCTVPAGLRPFCCDDKPEITDTLTRSSAMDMGEPLHSRHRALPRVGEVPFLSLVHLYRASHCAKRLANGKRMFEELARRHPDEHLFCLVCTRSCT